MQRGDRHDRVVTFSRERVAHDVTEDACDIGRRDLPGRFDHLRRPVERIDMPGMGGQFGGERPGAASDIKDPRARGRQLPHEQPVVLGVAVPVQ